ncbi:biopolymer transporter ExbD [Falsihalocynthiibacter arcticus]|uniref:Biopolymer transporter ExbD n=1 Tax=Falsihalocynthiibacter arcticus TaxID=1579316 RepID=A0A126V658_9RHOB|nr:biopolymer transporter ExbD [Falsihalocynthiibacter arcticus]AML53637.1 hypothetical protein RC74_11450 [Falsihalocynthiibacter arcticus]
MTSLIDVIFLLLLFFMLSSTFSKYGTVPLTSRASGGAVGIAEETRFLKLEKERLLWNGQSESVATLEGVLGDLPKDKSTTVLLHLSPDVSSQRLVEVLTTFHAFSNLQLSVLE